jgi:hypothetical protein
MVLLFVVPVHSEVYSIQHYVINFVSDFRPVGGFLRVLCTNKTDCHDITEILLKMALNTIKQTNIVQKKYNWHSEADPNISIRPFYL